MDIQSLGRSGVAQNDNTGLPRGLIFNSSSAINRLLPRFGIARLKGAVLECLVRCNATIPVFYKKTIEFVQHQRELCF